MNILITGAHGFVGRNLTETLKAVRDGKDRSRGLPAELNIFECTRETPPELLNRFCSEADFVFHLAGVNRSQREEAFLEGNRDFTRELLSLLERQGNPCPVLLASSIQAERDNPYGRSKRAGEALVRAHGERNDGRVLIYRLPNLFGKWCRPHYNSVIATFCHQIAREQPIAVHDPEAILTLSYIDDVVSEFLRALLGRESREGGFCRVPEGYQVSLGRIAELLREFHNQPRTLLMPELPADSFEKKLYSTYLSYLPGEAVCFPLTTHRDQRGSFTELLKTQSCGQFSVNISRPGVTKGQHWHHSKWEFFIVVSGCALIQERQIGGSEVLAFEVSGDRPEAVHMLPGYTHSITNLSDSEELVTLMWANEVFDSQRPDTYFEPVEFQAGGLSWYPFKTTES